jgi:hypothetical protein
MALNTHTCFAVAVVPQYASTQSLGDTPADSGSSPQVSQRSLATSHPLLVNFALTCLLTVSTTCCTMQRSRDKLPSHSILGDASAFPLPMPGALHGIVVTPPHHTLPSGTRADITPPTLAPDCPHSLNTAHCFTCSNTYICPGHTSHCLLCNFCTTCGNSTHLGSYSSGFSASALWSTLFTYCSNSCRADLSNITSTSLHELLHDTLDHPTGILSNAALALHQHYHYTKASCAKYCKLVCDRAIRRVASTKLIDENLQEKLHHAPAVAGDLSTHVYTKSGSKPVDVVLGRLPTLWRTHRQRRHQQQREARAANIIQRKLVSFAVAPTMTS